MYLLDENSKRMDWQPTGNIMLRQNNYYVVFSHHIRRLLTKAYRSTTEFSGASLNMSFDRTPYAQSLAEPFLKIGAVLIRWGVLEKYAIGLTFGERMPGRPNRS
jgi:hypothetical protein